MAGKRKTKTKPVTKQGRKKQKTSKDVNDVEDICVITFEIFF